MGLLYDYHVMLTLGFVEVTDGYVKKAAPKPCLFILFHVSKNINTLSFASTKLEELKTS